jgi:hypothetical protein
VSTWGVSLNGTQQGNLIVSDFGEPVISVDDLEIAQFIYFLLNSRGMRSAIDQIVSKVVLILGRFSVSRKPTLGSVRELLRSFGYVPIVFDFPAPESCSGDGVTSRTPVEVCSCGHHGSADGPR